MFANNYQLSSFFFWYLSKWDTLIIIQEISCCRWTAQGVCVCMCASERAHMCSHMCACVCVCVCVCVVSVHLCVSMYCLCASVCVYVLSLCICVCHLYCLYVMCVSACVSVCAYSHSHNLLFTCNKRVFSLYVRTICIKHGISTTDKTIYYIHLY